MVKRVVNGNMSDQTLLVSVNRLFWYLDLSSMSAVAATRTHAQ